MSSPNTLQDFHTKALEDFGITAFWPEAVLKEAKVKKENIDKVRKILDKNSNHYDLIGEVIEGNISI